MKELDLILDRAAGLHPEFASLIRGRIASGTFKGARGRMRRRIRHMVGRLQSGGGGLSRRAVLNLLRAQPTRPRVVYVTGQSPHLLTRQSTALRSQGSFETIVLTSNPWLTKGAVHHFDGLHVFASIGELAELLGAVNTATIHVRGSVFAGTYWGVLAKLLARSGTKVVFEFYDVASYMFAWDVAAEFWPREDVNLERYAEEYLCSKVDGILHGYSPEGAAELARRYRIRAPMLEFHAYVRDDWRRPPKAEPVVSRDRLRLVYAGNVESSEKPARLFGDVQFTHQIEELTNQGLSYDIYTPPYQSKAVARRYFADYYAQQDRNQSFSFNFGMVSSELTTALSRYDFGLMLYRLERVDVGWEHYKWRLPGKFFTYLEAGLPIVVNAEFSYVASVIEKYGIGVVVRRDQRQHLSKILAQTDFERMGQNIEAAQREFSMDAQAERLRRFYREIAAYPPAGD